MFHRSMPIPLLLCCAIAGIGQAHAEEGAAAPAYKLTTGWYGFSDHSSGIDLNLRRSSESGNLWLGWFRLADQDIRQWRGGWDNSYGEAVRISPSIQLASGGFVGGSIGIETGAPWFVGAGLGRTNLRPYWNLNFDPNDAYTLSAGHRSDDNQLFMWQLVRDNRENPDQRHMHFLYRQPLADGQRLTVDALYKTGRVDDATIHRWGLTLAYDWPRFFVRAAWDPKTNFTSVDALRLAIGTRF
ncbi:MAG TPA: hypothetical protein VI279_11110 [Rhodocyclaceae bacterium]